MTKPKLAPSGAGALADARVPQASVICVSMTPRSTIPNLPSESLAMNNPVQRTDFVSIPVQDTHRAKTFYRDVLGMQSPDWDANWPEIETGNVSLYLVDPTVMGNEFAPHSAPIALRVPSVPDAKSELETRGLQFTGENDTGVCKMAFFEDSEGNSLMLHRRYAP